MNSKLPFMKRWPMQFWSDEDVIWLAAEDPVAHLIYSALLDHMWINGGSIRDDDRVIAAMLKVPFDMWLRLRPVVTAVLVSFHDEDGLLRLTQKRLAADFDLASKTLETQREILAKGRDKENARKAKRSKAKAAAAQEPAQDTSDRAQSQEPVKSPPPQEPSAGAANAKQSRAEAEKKEEPSPAAAVAVERGSGGEKIATDKKATSDQPLKPKSLSDIANMIRDS